MPTPLYVCDDEFKSITILPQDPERAVHVLKCLIRDGFINPSGFEKAYFDFPYEVAPLEIVCNDRGAKYSTVNVLSGLVGANTYVTFLDKIGADVLYNYRFTFQMLDLFCFKYDDEVKEILKSADKLCDAHGIYSAQLVSGKYFTYRKNGKEEKHLITGRR